MTEKKRGMLYFCGLQTPLLEIRVNEKVNMTIVCPITNTNRSFPLHIPLDDRTKTTGFVLCEHIKSIDLEARSYHYVERIPQDLLEEIISTVFSEIEKPE